MRTFGLEETSLDSCVKQAQKERVVLTRNGKPVALVVGIEGLDQEQLEVADSNKFWELIQQRRGQSTLSREELEQRLDCPA